MNASMALEFFRAVFVATGCKTGSEARYGLDAPQRVTAFAANMVPSQVSWQDDAAADQWEGILTAAATLGIDVYKPVG